MVMLKPIGSYILKKQAWRSALHIFSALNTSLPGQTLPGKMQLPVFSLSAAVIPKQKAANMAPLATSRKVQNFMTNGLPERYSG